MCHNMFLEVTNLCALVAIEGLPGTMNQHVTFQIAKTFTCNKKKTKKKIITCKVALVEAALGF